MRRLQIIQLPSTTKMGIRSNGYTNACVHDAVREMAYKYIDDRMVRRMMARKTVTTADLELLEQKKDVMSRLDATFWRLCRAHRLDPKTTTSGQLINHLLEDDEFETYMIIVHEVVDRYIGLHAHLTMAFYEERGVAYF